MIPLGCVTGRFQPVHDQHMELFGIALARCAHLVVAVTNPDAGTRRQEDTSAHRHTRAANPFTYYERARLLGAALDARGWTTRTTLVPFDLTRAQLWPEYVPAGTRHFVRAFSDWEREKARRFVEAGYPVTVLDGDPAAKLHATDVRAALLEDGWRAAVAGSVPAATVPLLAALLAARPLRDRS